MSAIRFALLAAATAAFTAGPAAAPLRIIRTTPAGDAGPIPAITVTFDRPVAGSLDRTVDPATVLNVQPAIPGRLEWRDPVTIRLIPSAPLPADTKYTVTVSTAFTAMDGERLPEPFTFTFRVRGPVLFGVRPLQSRQVTDQITPDQRFDLIYGAPVDLARLSAAVFIEMSPACAGGGNRIIRVRATGQRPIVPTDDWQLRDAGGYQRERGADSLRRLVQIVPERPLPHGCGGELVAPAELAEGMPQGLSRWAFRTYGDLRIAGVQCDERASCPKGPAYLSFTTPVRGADVQRLVKIYPATPFTIRDTSATSTFWQLEATLVPNRSYSIVADTGLRDVFGQKLTGNPAVGFRTTGFATAVSYPFGRQLVERNGFQTLAIQHVNADTLVALIAPIPDSLEASLLSSWGWSDDEKWNKVAGRAETRRIPVKAGVDTSTITGLRLPVVDASRPGTPTLFAVKVRPTRRGAVTESPVSLVQVTDLGVTARIGMEEGMVWVTGVNDGLPKPGARVVLRGPGGKVIASGQTDARGLARLSGYRFAPGDTDDDDERSSLEGYVSATLGTDRGIVAINRYDPDLGPWNFGMENAWADSRFPIAGAVFTERGIYRPGEQVYAKAIVRTGNLGALSRPARTDSLKWHFSDRDGETVLDTTVALSEFGTAAHTLTIPASAPIGHYGVSVEMKRFGEWRQVAWSGYRVAEYRPPEFLVDVATAQAPASPGDRFRVNVSARYLFGAPMGRAELQWTARQTPVYAWELDIPGTDGWQLGESGWWWDEVDSDAEVFANGMDTLDARGTRSIETTLPAAKSTRAARVTVEATITDVNRQTVGSATTTLVHPAAFYVAARPRTDSWFWRAGEAQSIAVRAVRPDGAAESGVRVRGTLVRREWHQVRRERGGVAELVGDWVSDTVARCNVTTTAATTVTNAPACALTPAAGGMHLVILEATDARGRRAATSFGRYVEGPGFVPWSDETQFKMEVIADRDRYSVGDTATVMLASPFTDAEAWVTVEREGIIEQRRLRLTSGATTLKLPITEAYAPNAYVSVVVARGRTAPPGKLEDPGRPTLRVGYAKLRVTPEVKRLTVQVQPLTAEYRPGDSARVRLTVRDRRGAGARSEVTLWAVDEGVLALTGYKTPDPISLLYQERGLGMRLASNLVAVAPQIPEGEKGRREAGGGGGAAGAEVLRSRFKTTAFFLGSVITDAAGNAVVGAKLPDNLTTFRVMAVAVTAGDRYGSGESPLLVTRPLVARPALPRFVRPGDQVTAGTVVNRRDGSASEVSVTSTATGIQRTGPAVRSATLAAGKGAEVRFPFRAQPGDSATFRFDVRGGSDVDAVQLRIPIEPDYHPRSYTVAGVLRDTATAEFLLPEDIDPVRSRLTLNLGTSPLAIIRGIQGDMHVYPYYCTEQVVSVATPILALMRAEQSAPGMTSGRGRADIERAVAMLSARQRADGGIGYWSSTDWTTPWLSAYAAHVLLDAREVGVAVDSGVVARLSDYLRATLRGELAVGRIPVSDWYERRSTRLGDQVAAADLLSRLGTPDVGAENELVRMAPQMSREDRIRLATVLQRRGARGPARDLLTAALAEVRVEGRRAVLPPIESPFYFQSRTREEARLLIATLAIEPGHALIGPLVETLVQQGRSERGWMWNTQDYAFIVQALAEFEKANRGGAGRSVRVRAGNRTLLQATSAAGATAGPVQGDTSIALEGLLGRPQNEQRALRVALDMPSSTPNAVAYYYLTVTEVPLRPPVRPDDAGIRVERWYERYDDARPVTSVVEGDLVRVRLKVTIPATRHFVVLDDALPAGLEAIDLSLRTSTSLPGPAVKPDDADAVLGDDGGMWGYGSWDSGWWTPWDHRELRDERVVYAATVLWPGTYSASYVARATTPGVFVRPPAHAEEMYNPAVHGRSDGGVFTVTERPPR